MDDLWVPRTLAATRFRRHAGHANYRLNTIMVGLEAVKGGAKVTPSDLAVRWEPRNLVTASELARDFATDAILVYVVDALDGYMADLGNQEAWIQDPTVASMLRREFQIDRTNTRTASSSDIERLAEQLLKARGSVDDVSKLVRGFNLRHFGKRKAPSMGARFAQLCNLAGTVPAHYAAMVQLLISWRNRHVHGNKSDLVDGSVIETIANSAQELFDQHARLDVQAMIDRYTSGKSPTFKHVSTLISVLHRVVAAADVAIVRKADLDHVLKDALRSVFTKNPKRLQDYWAKSTARRIKKLAGYAREMGFETEGKRKPGASDPLLPKARIEAVASLSREEFAETIGLPLPT